VAGMGDEWMGVAGLGLVRQGKELDNPADCRLETVCLRVETPNAAWRGAERLGGARHGFALMGEARRGTRIADSHESAFRVSVPATSGIWQMCVTRPGDSPERQRQP